MQFYPHADKLTEIQTCAETKRKFNVRALAGFEVYYGSRAEFSGYMHSLKKETMRRYKWKEKIYLLKQKEFLEHYLIR